MMIPSGSRNALMPVATAGVGTIVRRRKSLRCRGCKIPAVFLTGWTIIASIEDSQLLQSMTGIQDHFKHFARRDSAHVWT